MMTKTQVGFYIKRAYSTTSNISTSAVTEIRKVLANPSTFGEEKTTKMNDMLNNLVPYFRCSDEDIVKVYYFLWSLQLMYYKGEM